MTTGQELKGLSHRHFRIVDLAVKGWSEKAIADYLGMGQRAVTLIFNSPTFRHELAIRRAVHEERDDKKQIAEEDEVAKTLQEGAKHAADKLIGHVDSFDDSISVKSCTEVLDRSGHGKKLENKNTVVVPTVIINNDDGKLLVESLGMIDEQV